MANRSSTLKSSVVSLGLMGLWSQAAFDPSGTQTSLLEHALREGGFFALVLMLLWFYRRDTKWATEFWKDEAGKRETMIRESTRVQAEVAAALTQNTVVVHQAKRVLEQYLSAQSGRFD